MVDNDASLPPADVQRLTDEAWCACGHEWAEDHHAPAAGGNFSSWCRICGVDCSVDVPRPEPLTEEELAAIEARAQRFEHLGVFDCVPRLIADLRASRARVKELEAEVAWFNERIDNGEL